MVDLLGLSISLIASIIFSFALLRNHMSESVALTFAFVSSVATLLIGVFRYDIAVSASTGVEWTSDTYRYLQYGQQSALAGENPIILLLSNDGTAGMIGLSHVAFRLIDSWLFVYLLGCFIGLFGSLFFLKAILIAKKQVPLRYAYLLVLFPSVVYWSSSFGKEAFSLFSLGLATLAIVRVHNLKETSNSGFSGWFSLGLALFIAYVTRPEIAALIGVGVVAAVVFTRPNPPYIKVRPLAWTVLIFPFLLSIAIALNFEDPFGVMEGLTGRSERTSIGDSQIVTSQYGGVVGVLLGIPTAVFRPFPWEAGIGGLGSSLDTLLILIALRKLFLSVRGIKSFGGSESRLFVFCAVAILSLFVPLAEYGNLGLLARMRSLLIPFVILVLIIVSDQAIREFGPKRAIQGSRNLLK